MKTLLTAREAIQKGPVKDTFPTTYVCDQLALKERKAFRDCLSQELYTLMLDDAIFYPDEPYSLAETYQTGDVVTYNGLHYISLQDSNDKRPDTVEYWEIAPKFQEECYNEIWCSLSLFLSFRVLMPAIRYATYQAGGKGVVIHMEHGDTAEKTADSRSFEQYLRQMESDSETMLDDIKYQMKNSECASKFPIFDACGYETKKCRVGLKRFIMK